MEKFSYEANGYNRNEVSQFVNDVIRETEGLVERAITQREEIKRLTDELEHYKELESTLKKTITSADDMKENIIKMANEEKEMILQDAKNNASRIVNEALIKAEKLESKSFLAKRNIKKFKKKLEHMIEEQQELLNEINDIDE